MPSWYGTTKSPRSSISRATRACAASTSSSTSAGVPAVPRKSAAARTTSAGSIQAEPPSVSARSATAGGTGSVVVIRRSGAVPLVVRQVVVGPDLRVRNADELEGAQHDVAPPGLAADAERL